MYGDFCSLQSVNSSYINNTSNFSVFHSEGDSLILKNNTFVNDSTKYVVYDRTKGYSAYVNNTIVGNIVSMTIDRIADVDSFDFVGNIILGNGSKAYEEHIYSYIYPKCLSEILALTNRSTNATYNLSTILRSTPYTSGTDYSTWKPSNNTNLLVKPYTLENEAGCIICPYSIDKLEEEVLTSIYEGT